VAWFEERNAYLDAQFSAAQPPTPPAAPEAKAGTPEPPALPPCPLHPGEVLALHTGQDGRQWRSHRVAADGSWCKGRARSGQA
jgi:hypothetical protein